MKTETTRKSKPSWWLLTRVCAGIFLIAVSTSPVKAQSGSVPASQVSQLVTRVRSAGPGDAAMSEALTLGQILIIEKRFAEAALLYDAVVDKNPQNAAALYGGALATVNLGKLARAEPLARAAVAATNQNSSNGVGKIAPRTRTSAADALVLLAVVLAVKGDDQEALKTAREAVRIAPDHFDAQFTLGRALYSVGDLASAATAFRVAVRVNPADQRALFFLGTTLEQAGDLESAADTYRQLITKQPSVAEGHLGLGTILVRRGGTQTEEGIEALKSAIALNPDLYEARVTLGRALVARGRAAQSIEHLVRAAELSPGNPEPQYQLSLAYRRLRRYDKAADATAIVRRIHENRRASGVQSRSQMP
ncbi:MAG: tetratricopeptide repeat protein, partial [Pyrinomonadaceae bacterium]